MKPPAPVTKTFVWLAISVPFLSLLSFGVLHVLASWLRLLGGDNLPLLVQSATHLPVYGHGVAFPALIALLMTADERGDNSLLLHSRRLCAGNAPPDATEYDDRGLP